MRILVKSHKRKGRIVRSHARKKVTADQVRSSEGYRKLLSNLSDRHSEDLRGDGSFPKNHEASQTLRDKFNELKKNMSKAEPKPRTFKPGKISRQPAPSRKGMYRIMGTNEWRKGL